MDKISSLFQLKDKRFKFALVILLLIAIPLTVFLVRQQQILKSRALGEGSTLDILVGSSVNPATTTSSSVSLKLTWNPGSVTPTPTLTTTPTPTLGGQPTSTPVPTSTAASPTPTSTGGRCPGEGGAPVCLEGVQNCVASLTCGVPCAGSKSVCYVTSQGQEARICCDQPSTLPTPTPTIVVSQPTGPFTGSISCTACQADIIADGVVDNTDILFLASPCKSAGNFNNLFSGYIDICKKMDINGNNAIEAEELNCAILQANQNGSCIENLPPPTSVPFPTSEPPTPIPTEAPCSYWQWWCQPEECNWWDWACLQLKNNPA